MVKVLHAVGGMFSAVQGNRRLGWGGIYAGLHMQVGCIYIFVLPPSAFESKWCGAVWSGKEGAVRLVRV